MQTPPGPASFRESNNAHLTKGDCNATPVRQCAPEAASHEAVRWRPAPTTDVIPAQAGIHASVQA
jgi:hypothetical protein